MSDNHTIAGLKGVLNGGNGQHEGCIYVNVESLNHADTKASLRLEPNRRSLGGRVYEHVAYKTDKGYIPLETIRNELEEKMWNKLLNK